jgi:CheY-like chemotaxis protein
MTAQKLSVLIVEDDKGVAETLKDTLEQTVPSKCVVTSFEQAPELIGSHFDVVVLDQFEGDPALGNNAGQPLWQQVREKSFVPVVVYSAAELVLDESFPKNNPILKHIKKGMGTDKQVAAHLNGHKSLLFALKNLKNEVSVVMKSVLTVVVPVVLGATGKDSEKEALQLARSARRRLAAMMDMGFQSTGENLLAWEQYICPPLNDQWLTGDILRLREGDPKDPSNYKMFLTPSCDLQLRAPDGKRGVEKVLVCGCTKIGEYLKSVSVPENKLERLSSWLTRPHANGFIPLPGYHDQIPCMAARLKDLDLIPIDEIGDKAKYVIVASIDSPFREQISWAFIEVHGRPAVPDRDLDKWIEQIKETLARKS